MLTPQKIEAALAIEPLVTVTVAATRCGVSRRTIQRLLKNGYVLKEGTRLRLSAVKDALTVTAFLKDQRGRKRGFIPKNTKQRPLEFWGSKSRPCIPSDKRIEIIFHEFGALVRRNSNAAIMTMDLIFSTLPPELKELQLAKWNAKP